MENHDPRETREEKPMIRRTVVVSAVVALIVATVSVAGASPWETADISGQGMGGPIVAEDGAKIHRTAKGVTASVSMPAPAPGEYAVPEGPTSSGEEGSPAAFSLWVFIFFNPDACDGSCDGPDLAGEDVVAAGYNAGGHLVAGPHLTISGKVNAQSRAFGPPGVPVCTGADAGDSVCVETVGQALALGHTLADAEVHLAVAPHGKLDPSLLPAQITTPAGNAADHWWTALFK